ncbi:MAG: DUF2232 domain-containing protein [Spirochaetota bacterium]
MIELIIAAVIGFALVAGTALVVYRYQWKVIVFLIPLLIAAIIIMLSKGETFSYILAPVITGGCAGFTFKNGRGYQFFLLLSTIMLTIFFTLNFYMLKTVKGVDLMQQSRVQFENMLESSEMNAGEKREVMERVDQSMPIIRKMVPFSYFLNVLVFAMISFAFLRYLFSRIGFIKVLEVSGVERFKLNDYSIFILIAGWLIVLLVPSQQYSYVYLPALNIALIMSVFYIIQGTGILKYIFMSRGWPSFILPIIFLVSLLLGPVVILFVIMLLLGIGSVDFWMDFRKISSISADGEE